MKASQLLCNRFNLSLLELETYSHTCPFKYKNYFINKRNGGQRLISQPSKDLKLVQRFLLENFLNKKMPIHECAKAYKANTSIIDNARPHLKNAFLLKLDFANFFPSIKGTDFLKYLIDNKIVENNFEALLLQRIFFKKTDDELRLTIGSPGSPTISNALLYNFDDTVSKLAKENSITYTRYSDDMTFSTNIRGILFNIPKNIETLTEKMTSPSLKINNDKTVFSSKKFNRHVTGITITNNEQLSIGHRNKRLLRSQIFRSPTLNDKEIEKLRGEIAFACQVEKKLFTKLYEKYPKELKAIMGNSYISKRIYFKDE